MAKIIVKLCVGTTCYVMGGSDLLLLSEKLTDKQKELVEIKGTPCLEHCFSKDIGNPPYAFVNDVAVSEASVEKIIAEINNIIEQEA